MNTCKLNAFPFPGGTFVKSFSNEFYLYAEKAFELTNNENFVLLTDDKSNRFTLHWVGGLDGYLEAIDKFCEIYEQIIKIAIAEYKN